ncbi:MAG: hypothetical protein IJ777_01275 [Clostridia bacterium]|nr:hypothetical protein [Clostridia bacterium]
MAWFSSWAQGIVVSVIIGTIIEMILPEESSQKYIKVVVRRVCVVFDCFTRNYQANRQFIKSK